MSATAPAPRPTELRLGRPDDFDGTSTKARSWLESIQIYLLVNQEIYDTDAKRVAFMISFMKSGSAQTWASTYMQKVLARSPPSFDAFADTVTAITEAFIHGDAQNEAINWLANTRVSAKLPLTDYISQFKNNVALSKVTDENVLITFFAKGITTSMMRRIYSMDTAPTTIDQWYTKAVHFKNQWDKADYFAKSSGSTYQYHQHQGKQSLPPKAPKDPFAMDVDSVRVGKLTDEERKRCRDNNLCFRCRKPGHSATACKVKFDNSRTVGKVEEGEAPEPVEVRMTLVDF
jgi:hypothetical protein